MQVHCLWLLNIFLLYTFLADILLLIEALHWVFPMSDIQIISPTLYVKLLHDNEQAAAKKANKDGEKKKKSQQNAHAT